MPFSNLGLSDVLVKALIEQKYTKPYPIQEQVIPEVIKGKDILGISQTGSGKTASFVLPIIHILQQLEVNKNRNIRALILVPTRELAVQVGDVFKIFAKAAAKRIKTLAVHGGVSMNPQMKNMNGVDVLVATPGRLLELIYVKAVSLSDLRILVLDEADKMLNLGFQEQINKIFKFLPAKRQNLLFSATLGNEVDIVAKMVLNNPLIIEIESEELNINLIKQSAYAVEEEQKGPFLRYLIKSQNMQQVLVFASSVQRVDAIVFKLNKNNIQAEGLHSKKSQGSRAESYRKFKSGTLRVLVATDVMARGIDIPFLPFVINYELPRSPKDYIHRIGRTGRAESSGDAISMISSEELHHFGVIQKKMKKNLELIDTKNISLKGY